MNTLQWDQRITFYFFIFMLCIFSLTPSNLPAALIATNPKPAPNAKYVEHAVVLSWTPGTYAAFHDVYIGTVYNDVKYADVNDTSGIYKGRKSEPNCFVGPLAPKSSYYWRVDEVNDSNIWNEGLVWPFKTRGYVDFYSNPVISDAVGKADPTVLFHQGIYYVYPTGDNTSYYVFTSCNLVEWTKGPQIFVPGGINVWAPDVFYNTADEKFYLYYVADWRIGVAVADKPDATFTDAGTLINGAIDPHVFQDSDGKYYLYFATSQIYVQEMTDPLHLAAWSPVSIIGPNEPWEGYITEGPWLIKNQGIYYLLYSGNRADMEYYAVGYATATDPMGPFTKYRGNPIISEGNGVFGPGHGSVTKDAAGNLWHVYHQKQTAAEGWPRFICIDPLWFDSNGVLHSTATRGTPQNPPVIAKLPSLDSDYDIDMRDIAVFSSAFESGRSDDNWNPFCDIFRPTDGFVDLNDLAVLLENWLFCTSPTCN